VAAFALASALTAAAGGRRPVLVGIAAAAFVCAAGTLDAAQRLVADGGPLRDYDWFAAARVVPDAITEFPAFSFLLGDLHAHLIAVPLTLLALGFALQAAVAGPRWQDLPAVGLAVGCLYAVNAWSFPVVAALVAAAPVLWLRDPAQASSPRRAAGWVIGAGWVAVLAFAPYWIDYTPATGGLGLVDERRPLTAFAGDQIGLLGVFGWLLAAGFAGRLLATRAPLRTAAWIGVAALVAGSLLAPFDLAGPLLVAGLVAVALRAALVARLAAERFGWLLVAGGLGCVLLPELVYVRDEFDGGELFRMNTVFKLGFQAWILLAVAAACALPRARRELPRALQRPWGAVAVVLVGLAAVYPVAGTYARKAGFSDGPRLDGRRWLAPGDVAAIDWLRDRAAPGAVVLEAVGDDYSEFGHARISTFSGRATVLGWPGHELQWGHDAGSRRSDVAAIYRAPLPAVADRLLRRYGVDYVVVGALERTDYGSDGVAKFDRIGRRVLERDGTIVWRVGR
jgi:YYY domain-containing protein